MSTEKPDPQNSITIKGAREHNLKNIDVSIPRNRFTVITGISGSGKSSLAFDTIYAEGQRRYVESLSSYARQFLGLMNKPDADSIDGLSPAISIEQKSISHNPRSTVGTVTEIHDYLRLLYARIGHAHCPNCGKPIKKQTTEQIVTKIQKLKPGAKITILAPTVRSKKGEYISYIDGLTKKGISKVIIDGTTYETTEHIELDKNKKHNIELIIDRIILGSNISQRLHDACEKALKLASGLMIIKHDKKEKLYSTNFACPECDINLPEFTPRMFSFNNPYGACPACHGLGTRYDIDPDLVIPDKSLTIQQGAIHPWKTQVYGFRGQILKSLAEHYKFDLDTPISHMKKEHLNILLYGTDEKIHYIYNAKTTRAHWEHDSTFEGIIPQLMRLHKQTKSDYRRREMEKYMTHNICATCEGKRLKKESLAVTVGDLSIADLSDLSCRHALEFTENLNLTEREQLIANQILKEIRSRLTFLTNVGVDYLTLSRSSATLSGGEAQRIRLATQIGSKLTGVLYVLDEPSIGLHQRDNKRLITTLTKLRDLQNTVIVVEHDEEMIRSADHIIDIGPGAGIHGGKIVAEGPLKSILASKNSLTGQYLSGKKNIEPPKTYRHPKNFIEIIGARQNNLKNIDVSFPMNIFTCVTGVSGSGKSSLVHDILYKGLMNSLYRTRHITGKHIKIKGLQNVDKVVLIDQSPIGRTPRSNPATYTGVFTYIRELFSATQDAKIYGYAPGRFSFNVESGRCTACDGDGVIKIEMHFLPDIYVPCEVCKGKRYNKETLSVYYKQKNIADVLDMTIEEAREFFKNIPRVKNKLDTLYDVGLGYIKLGQSSTTLSGGEAQRIKLASELSKRGTGKTIYLLDEPTTGLHFDDIKKLLKVLNRLVDNGDTVIVIEHNLDVIKCADYIIDLGPEGGDKGGKIVAEGTPEQLVRRHTYQSYTAQYLKPLLEK